MRQRNESRKVTGKEMQGLVGPDEILDGGLWFVAEHYLVCDGLIYPDGKVAKRSRPLLDRNLFLDFARLGAHGSPRKERIMSWVRKHGLLRRQKYDQFEYVDSGDEVVMLAFENDEVVDREPKDDGPKTVNQEHMKIEDLRSEIRLAYKALRLFEDIRSKNYGALKEKIEYKLKRRRGKQGTVVRVPETYLDGEPIPFQGVLEGDYSDEKALEVAARGLEDIVERKIADVSLAFGMDFLHPRPLSNIIDLQYRPRLSHRCPDLHSALWYQFAALMSDKRPWENCMICGIPFLQTRPDKVVCSKACQKRKERKGKKA